MSVIEKQFYIYFLKYKNSIKYRHLNKKSGSLLSIKRNNKCKIIKLQVDRSVTGRTLSFIN